MKLMKRMAWIFVLAVMCLPLASVAAQASGKTIMRVAAVPVGELDPAKASDYADSMLMFNVYDTLLLPKRGDVGYQPLLAKSWRVDGQDYVFKLRDDVKFTSGNPLTAADVVFSFNRMKAIGQGLSFLFKDVDSAEAIDEHTVKFHLDQPYGPFLSTLVRLPILDKKLVMQHLGKGSGDMKDWGQHWLSTHGAGSGAYIVVSHNPQARTVLRKNDDYFLDVPDAAPDRVHIDYGLSAATMRAKVAKDELDISTQWLPPEVLKSLAGDGARFLADRVNGEFYIKMNTAKPPLDDVHCRRALSAAYSYKAGLHMIKVTDDVAQGSAATGAIPVGMLGANPANDTFHQDLAAAKKELAACKYDPSDFKLEIAWISSVPIEKRFALLMQANFSQIGIQSTINKVPWALFTDQVSKVETTPNVSMVFVPSVTGDPDTLLYQMYHSSSAGTWEAAEHLDDAKVDELLEQGRHQTDLDARRKTYETLNARLIKLAPSIFAYDQLAVFAASNRFEAPALSGEPDKSFGVAAMGFMFRLMTMTDQ